VRDSPFYPILFMVAISAIYGAAVSAVAVATRARVEAGERARYRSYVLSTFDMEAPEDPQAVDRLWNERIEERSDARGPYFAARGQQGQLLGYAFPFSGPGFWGPIRGVLAVDPAGKKILGIAFTQHQETPGLGGRITEPWFRDQFRGKPLEPPPGGGPPLDFVFRKPQTPREVEAITGATQTSTRLEKFLDPFLRELAGRSVFREGGEG